MPPDRLLNQVLADYHAVHDAPQATDRLLGTTLTLLTELSNPLNLSLLTSHFLTAPAIWHRRSPDNNNTNNTLDPLRSTCVRVLSLYNTAAIHVHRNELANADRRRALGFGISASQPVVGGGLKSEAWARAVVKGADERSSRWQHLLVLVGILLGFEGEDRHCLTRGMRRTLEGAVVTAANLALRAPLGGLDREPPVAGPAVALALSWAFPLLQDGAREELDCDALLPVVMRALVGDAGFEGGMFLGRIGVDVRPVGSTLDWPESSPSFAGIRNVSSKPLVESAGPLSKVVAHCIERARDHRLVLQAQDELATFTARLLDQWRQSRLCEVDIYEEAVSFTNETLQVTTPMLWRLLTNVLFASVFVLRAVTARSLLDHHLRNHAVAPVVASKTLHIYRNLYFIACRGNDGFQAYTFSYLTAIDVLARYSEPSGAFLREIVPRAAGLIPMHAVERALDLFYLNTAEHLPLKLSPEACENLIIQPATAYLSHSAPNSSRIIELFEAAHAAVLSVLSCPQNGSIAVKMAPFYAETLLTSFPSRISPRQFRLAFSTLMQILSPPFPVSATQPELAETLLEMVHYRIPQAGQGFLLPTSHDQGQGQDDKKPPPPMSEQSALVLTLIDALPFLPIPIMEEWMNIAAGTLWEVHNPTLREVAKQRLWDILSSGEMDVERAAIGVAWWGTRGGRELVLFGPRQADAQEPFMMSGAIVDETQGSRL